MSKLTFLDSSAIHCLIRTWEASGHPVMLRNTSAGVRRILELADGKPHALTFDQDREAPPPKMETPL
jgi:anti-anti-sigma regulatory factor